MIFIRFIQPDSRIDENIFWMSPFKIYDYVNLSGRLSDKHAISKPLHDEMLIFRFYFINTYVFYRIKLSYPLKILFLASYAVIWESNYKYWK